MRRHCSLISIVDPSFIVCLALIPSIDEIYFQDAMKDYRKLMNYNMLYSLSDAFERPKHN